MITDNKEVIIMSEVTAPIMTDATGQSIDSKLNSLLEKMDNLAAAFQPNASGIVYSNTTSGLTGDDVQEAIDEMAADVSEIKSSLSNKFVIATGTYPNSAGDALVSYPSGCNSTNCVVIGLMVFNSGVRWDAVPNNNIAYNVILMQNEIHAYNNNATYYNHDIKIVLMRTDI